MAREQALRDAVVAEALEGESHDLAGTAHGRFDGDDAFVFKLREQIPVRATTRRQNALGNGECFLVRNSAGVGQRFGEGVQHPARDPLAGDEVHAAFHGRRHRVHVEAEHGRHPLQAAGEVAPTRAFQQVAARA